MAKNVIIGQSGGPTAVINSSLAGVYKAACSLGADKVYGIKKRPAKESSAAMISL